MFVILATVFAGLGGPDSGIKTKSLVLPGVYVNRVECESTLLKVTNLFSKGKRPGEMLIIKCAKVKGTIQGIT